MQRVVTRINFYQLRPAFVVNPSPFFASSCAHCQSINNLYPRFHHMEDPSLFFASSCAHCQSIDDLSPRFHHMEDRLRSWARTSYWAIKRRQFVCSKVCLTMEKSTDRQSVYSSRSTESIPSTTKSKTSARSSPSVRSVVSHTTKKVAKSVRSLVKKGAATAARPFKKVKASLSSRASSVPGNIIILVTELLYNYYLQITTTTTMPLHPIHRL